MRSWKAARSSAAKNLQAATGLDVNREILPNIGPDIGFAILPAEGDGPGIPRMIAALRAKPEPKGSTCNSVRWS